MRHDQVGVSGAAKSRDSLRAALQAHKNGNISQALQLYESVLLSEPDNVSVLLLAGKILVESSAVDRGVILLRRAMELEPGSVTGQFTLAYGLCFQKHYDEALSLYLQILAQDPHLENIHYYIGDTLAKLGRHDEALGYLAKAHQMAPDDPIVIHVLNQVLIKIAIRAQENNQKSHARQMYETVLMSEPNNIIALLLLGMLLVRSDASEKDAEFEKGTELLRRAVALDPRQLTSQMTLAHGLRMQLMYKEALDIYLRVLAQDPGYEQIHYYAGLVLTKMGRYSEAVEHLSRELQVNPDDANVLFFLGLAKLSGNDASREEGVALIRQALANKPDLLGVDQPDMVPLQEYRQRQMANSLVFRTPDEPKSLHLPTPCACFSYPKCGTHLLSDITQLITNHHFYWPNDYESNSVPKDALSRIPDKHFLIGHWHATLELGADMQTRNYKAIVQYREPRDQMVSFYCYYTGMAADPHGMYTAMLTNVSQEEAFNRLIIGGPVKGGGIVPGQAFNMVAWMEQWRLMNAYYQVPVYFVSYEDMVENKVETIGRIARFLEMPLSREECEVIAEATGFHKKSKTMEKNAVPKNFKRKGIVGDWRNYFTEANRILFKTLNGEILTRLGYEE
ncbi:MAG: tetratricopeptide repeat protein [Magnetococcales bacterium]|nr:tetratricopeptide repeat protein [Magnetococcales bacterium]